MSKLAEQPPEDTLAAIARNLDAVLNARRGYAAAQVFGLGDHNVYEEAKPHLDALIADMTEQVRRFEPRLGTPTVRYAGHEGTLWARFELTGAVLGVRQTFKVLFHVILRTAKVTAPSAP